MNRTEKIPAWAEKIPRRARVVLSAVLSVATGLAAAVLLHYLLYRVALPSQPFIYVAF